MKKTILSIIAVAFAATISFSTSSCGGGSAENIPDSLLAGEWEAEDESVELELDTAKHEGKLNFVDRKSVEGAVCNSWARFTWEVAGDNLNLKFGDSKFCDGNMSYSNDDAKAKIEPVAKALAEKLNETYTKDSVFTYTGVVATDSTLTLNNGNEKLVLKKDK